MITDEQIEQAIKQHKALSALGAILIEIANGREAVLPEAKGRIEGLVTVGGPRSLGLLKDIVKWMGNDESLTEDENWVYDVIEAGEKVWQTLPEHHRPKSRSS